MLLLLFLVARPAPARELTIIELRHRPADQVIPILTPFLQPGDTLTGHGFTLFLRTGAANLSQLRSIVHNLDRASRQLTITVVQGENAREALRSIEASGSARVGDRLVVRSGPDETAPAGTLRLGARAGEAWQQGRNVQRVRVSENTEATLSIALAVPVETVEMGQRNGEARGERVLQYRQVMTGFSVVPRVSEDRFVLDIAARKEDLLGGDRPEVASQRIHTQVQGRLGEWTEIGGALSASLHSGQGILYSEQGAARRNTEVWLRVSENK